MVGMPDNFAGSLSLATFGYAYPQHTDLLADFGYLHFVLIADMFIPNMAERACQLLIEQFQYGRDE